MPSARQSPGTRDLLAIGLQDAARWQANGKKLEAVGHKSAAWSHLCSIPNCLYAFCAGDEVLYIGKTTQTLKKRFVGYCDPGNGRATNYKCHQGIHALLQRGKDVRILVLPSHAHLRWGRFEINLAAGLEDALVNAFKPAWNGINKRFCTETESNEESTTEKS